MTDTAAGLVDQARAVLLDFDGPVTRLMPPPANAQAADAARAPLAERELPPEVATTTDHLAVLRWVGAHDPNQLAAVEQACMNAEVAAARVSEPTLGSLEFLAWCKQADKPVVIVSNNAGDAVATFLRRFDVTGLVRGIVGRHPGRPELLKPHPSLVLAALDLAQVTAVDAVLVGDSVTDVEAAHATQLKAIGFAKSRARGQELEDAGATVIALMTRLIPHL